VQEFFKQGCHEKKIHTATTTHPTQHSRETETYHLLWGPIAVAFFNITTTHPQRTKRKTEIYETTNTSKTSKNPKQL